MVISNPGGESIGDCLYKSTRLNLQVISAWFLVLFMIEPTPLFFWLYYSISIKLSDASKSAMFKQINISLKYMVLMSFINDVTKDFRPMPSPQIIDVPGQRWVKTNPICNLSQNTPHPNKNRKYPVVKSLECSASES